jgi:hypothetical protein
MTGVVPDSEPNTPVVVVTPADEKRQVHFDEKAQPPAYESIVERMSREIEREQPPCTPISIQAADNANQAPTILVLFKEDVEWARVYLRDLDYKVALRRALRRHLYSELRPNKADLRPGLRSTEAIKLELGMRLTPYRVVRPDHYRHHPLGASFSKAHNHCQLL